MSSSRQALIPSTFSAASKSGWQDDRNVASAAGRTIPPDVLTTVGYSTNAHDTIAT